MSISLVVLTYGKESSIYGTKKKEDFENATFGVKVGSVTADLLRETYPNIKVEYFNELSDILAAMSINKIDATGTEETTIREVHRTYSDIKMVETPFGSYDQAFILSKDFCKEDNNVLLSEINEFIQKSKENGFIDDMLNKWSVNYNENVVYENKKIENPRKILKVVLSPGPPYTFVSHERYVGFDVEIFETFCEEYNYGYKYEYVDFGSVIMGIATGKYDIGIGGITISDERKKNMIFTDSHFTESSHVAYYEKGESGFILDEIKSSFYNSFIKENRYKLIIDGLMVTLLITIVSTISGMFLGFLMYVLYMKGIKILNGLINVYVYIMNGIPLLVFLMVLYYIVFANADVSGVVISIIGFSFAMGVFVFGAFVDYTKILDKGQMEASLALGYTNVGAFKKVVLPQIIINIFPSFKNRVIFLLKNTAIVGYIAVSDLTKAGDIIRSRTYEAIFPLLSIAFIYFVVGIVIKSMLGIIEKKINPRNRTKKQIMEEIGK